MTTQYPFLVYGTLRPGNGNYAFHLAGKVVHTETVTVEGLEMRATPTQGFPFVVPGEGSIVADLVYVNPDDYDQVLTSLDRLEGYVPDSRHNLYDRVLVQFTADGIDRLAYVYIASESTVRRITHIPVMEHGDWNKRSALV